MAEASNAPAVDKNAFQLWVSYGNIGTPTGVSGVRTFAYSWCLAVLTLPAAGGAGSLESNSAIVLDTGIPTMTGVLLAGKDPLRRGRDRRDDRRTVVGENRNGKKVIPGVYFIIVKIGKDRYVKKALVIK